MDFALSDLLLHIQQKLSFRPTDCKKSQYLGAGGPYIITPTWSAQVPENELILNSGFTL